MLHHGQIERADALLNAGNTAAARRIISDVLDADPQNRNALLLMAHIEQRDNNPEKVLEICRNVLALYPDSERVRGDLIVHLAKLKNHDEARTALDMYIRDFPSSTQIKDLKVIVHINRGDIPALKRDLVDLRADRGDNPTLNIIDGYIAEAEGSDAGAFASGVRAVQLEPANSLAHNLAARTAFRLFWLPSAMRHARACLAIDPISPHMRGIRRMSIACIFPPVLLACCALRLAGWMNPNAGPDINLRLIGAVYFIGALGLALEIIGIPRIIFYPAVAFSALYLFVETFVVAKREEKQLPDDIELRDY